MRIHRKHLKVVTERDAKLAWLLVNGHPGVEAARLVGYSPSYSKKIGRILRTWGVREAMQQEIERRRAEWREPRPSRRPTATRRAIFNAYQKAQQASIETLTRAQSPATTTRCPTCGRNVNPKDLHLNPSQTGYCCIHCG